MAAKKRTEREREADLAFIIPLWRKGYRYRDIAQMLSEERKRQGCKAPRISHVQVWQDIKGEIQRWRDERLDDVDAQKVAELDRLHNLEREAWEAYERSKAEFTRTSQEHVESGGKASDKDDAKSAPRKKVAITKEQRNGDPRFLDIVGKCIDRRCKILGVDAPQKIAPTDPTGENPYRAVGDEELKAIAAAIATSNHGDK